MLFPGFRCLFAAVMIILLCGFSIYREHQRTGSFMMQTEEEYCRDVLQGWQDDYRGQAKHCWEMQKKKPAVAGRSA